MSGAFDEQFADEAHYRPAGADDPRRLSACADHPAEAAVIGAMLADGARVDDLADILAHAVFADDCFARVFEAILIMSAAGEAATPITVARRLSDDDDLADRGGARYLADLAIGADTARAAATARHIVDLSRRRRLAHDLSAARALAIDLAKPIGESVIAIDRASTFALEGALAAPAAVSVATAWDTTMASIAAIAAGTQPRGVQIAGLREWNEITTGMHPGQMILLGGRPGMGKTALAVTVATGAAEAGHGVLFISIEMPVEQVMLRIIADRLHARGSTATFEDVQLGRLTDRDHSIAAQIRRDIDAWPLMFEEPGGGLSAARIAPMIRKAQRSFAAAGRKLELVVIDYLGLLLPPQKRDSKVQEVSDVSLSVKAAARACGVAVLALAQLNRGVEARDDKRPMLSDLRDSGSLEQDADVVVFAYREQYYLDQSKPKDGDAKKSEAWEIAYAAEKDRIEIWTAKLRQGATQRRRCYFFGNRQAIRSSDFYATGGVWR